MRKKAASWHEEPLPNGYVIAWRQAGPTGVSRTSGTVKLVDGDGATIEMCAGWGYGDDEDPQGRLLEERKAEYRDLAERHARGDFPYDTLSDFAGSLDARVEERENREYVAAVNGPKEE